jgi:hypothetical protein
MSGQYLVNAANDIKRFPRIADLGYGLALHLIGIRIGYLYEALLILDNPKDREVPTIESAKAGGERVICKLYDRLSAKGKAEYSSLMALKTDPIETKKFKKYVEKHRNQASFHYDAGHRAEIRAKKPVVESALDRLASSGKSSR